MPYIESGAEFNSENLVLSYASFANTTANYTQVSAYVCPSDGDFTQGQQGTCPTFTSPMRQTGGGMRTFFSLGRIRLTSDPTAPDYQNCNYDPGDGMFGYQVSFRIAQVTDGLSNTFLFGEVNRFKDEPSSPFSIGNLAIWFADDYSGYGYVPTSAPTSFPS